MFGGAFFMEQQPTLAEEIRFRKQIQIGFSTVIGLFWMGMASSAYNVLLLDSQNFSTAEVGVIMSIYSAIGIIAPPLWGYVADRMHSVAKAYIIVFAIYAFLVGSMPIFGLMKIAGFSFLAIALPLTNFVRTPAQNLMDAWSMLAVNRAKRVPFGVMRLWGSIGWAVSCVLLSFVAEKAGIPIVFMLCGCISVVVCLYSVRLNHKIPLQQGKKKEEKQEHTKINPALLFKNYYFVVLLIFHFIIQMMGNSSMLFLPYVFRSVGMEADMAGAVTGIKALMEVPFLLAGGLLVRRFKLPPMIGAAGCIYALEHFLYTQLSSPILSPLVSSMGPALILCIQMLSGLANGLYLFTSVQYAYRLAPPELSASAQTFLGMSMSMGAICASLLGGILIEITGVTGYYTLTSTVMLVGAVLFGLSFVFGEKVLKIPRPKAASATEALEE